MTERREQIMDVAETLIRTHGYNGFSFREIASAVGIKSASVHHHFPTKSKLAAAVARRYRVRFKEAIATAEENGHSRLTAWREQFRNALSSDGLMCLCGILAVEGDALPDDVALEARRFLEQGLASISEVTKDRPTRAPEIIAQLEGAMLIARATGDITLFDKATGSIVD